ncbi:MAG TPA: NnrS family protein [Gammaproteobacteria bacterium]|nr:NnrS family protein [Gammaproteobacteria bacterium]
MPILFAAPHRPFFFFGAAQLVVALLFWLTVLLGWHSVAMPALSVFGIAAHVFLMLYGLFTFFVFGFLSTVFPRWLATDPIPPRRYGPIACAMAAGIACFYAGIFTSSDIAVAGAVVFVAGWAGGLVTLLQVWRRSTRADKRFALFPFGCVSGGFAGACVYIAWLITQQPLLLDVATAAGLWLYLVPLIVAVSYRMIPFFSSNVLSGYTIVKPGWTLPATLACVVGHFGLTVSGNANWTVVPDLPLAVLAGWHAWRWGIVRALRVPLLGMLHLSFAWLAIAMGLYSADSVLRLLGSPAGLGFAPLHALGIGFVTGMVVAMASRVSLGHSGRPLVADGITLWTFAVVQVTAVVRVLAGVPPFQFTVASIWLLIAAAAIWLVAFIPWSLHFGRIYSRPRIDGRPG